MFKKTRLFPLIAVLVVLLSACDTPEREEENRSTMSFVANSTDVEDLVGAPMVIAHRGANDRYNESTITAYKIAARDGVDALEIDLRMTADGRLIAMHDETIDRTTDGNGKAEAYTLEEIKEFETVEVFNNQTTVEVIPTLEEIIDTFRDTEHYYIETRLVDGQPVMEDYLVRLLDDYELISQGLVIIQSFSKQSLEKVYNLEPSIPLTLLYRKGKFNLEDAKSVPYPFIGIESTDVSLEVVNELHEVGKKVHVYFTNNDTQKAEQKRVKAFQVDGYFTDYIEYTKELLETEDS
ncbi:glycerophosphodiester phosphodiesterase [Oceanobacillus bengalensis]|uniref:glycerophosphodiester phosphodiesterase n=1 Tax=Oceanobacillus bengalensis TaxID=1435466 RepID=UPI001601EE37|nr:glycerophosphodiester phosphodiesterase family protein [Oceanobacillus bengalensis]